MSGNSLAVRHRSVVSTITGVFLLFFAAQASANCGKAEKFFDRSLDASGRQQVALLEEAIRQCPNHTRALNNLGVAYEQNGNLAKAERLYRLSIESDPEFPPPYAGIADILLAKKRYAEAATAYDQFLDQLESASRLGMSDEFDSVRSEYEAKRNLARQKAGLPPVVVSADQVTRSLTSVVSSTRGIGAHYKDKAYINIPIHFAFNSAEVSGESMPQIEQIAAALKGPALAGKRILIEGHTDSRGTVDYNQELSERRAVAVFHLLVRQFGLAENRFDVQGFGEVRPVDTNKSEVGRMKNRRVTFVNLGGTESVISSQY